MLARINLGEFCVAAAPTGNDNVAIIPMKLWKFSKYLQQFTNICTVRCGVYLAHSFEEVAYYIHVYFSFKRSSQYPYYVVILCGLSRSAREQHKIHATKRKSTSTPTIVHRSVRNVTRRHPNDADSIVDDNDAVDGNETNEDASLLAGVPMMTTTPTILCAASTMLLLHRSEHFPVSSSLEASPLC